ncbi:MAG: squalene/phytoene synthase family protein, partial [Acidobacteriota bacterium]
GQNRSEEFAVPQTAETAPVRTSWKTCYRLLPNVSRTFALSIMGLRPPLKGLVCVGYLLCRILDTVEDAPDLSLDERARLIDPFLRALHNRSALPASWQAHVESLLAERASAHDFELMENTNHVLACLYDSDDASTAVIVKWVDEMGRGMLEFSDKMGREGSLKTLPDGPSLDRYCYYIAGTVGYMLTDLFHLNSPHIDETLYKRLEADAEAFGLGLQKVNILKDIRDDASRGWCFIPRSLLSKKGLTPATLADPVNADRGREALKPLLSETVEHLQRGWRYLCTMPVEEKEVRMFLASSLFFAARTLALSASAPGLLLGTDGKLKITRKEVAGLLLQLRRKISKPARLEQYWSQCSEPLETFASPAAAQL